MNHEGFRPTDPIAVHPVRSSRSFYDTHLMPELSDQMNGFRSLHGVPGSAAEIEQSMIFSSASGQVRGKTIKGAGNALKDYLLDVTSLARVIRSVPTPRFGIARKTGEGRAARPGSDVGFSFGFAHRMPNFGLKYSFGSTVTRFEVSGHGEVDIRFEREHARQVRTAIGMKYDPKARWYGLTCAVRF
jgi:hypothetical protein